MRPTVKICGLSTEPTLDAALDAGAERIGLNFFPRSPRFVSLARASALAARARGRAAIVALTVDADDETLALIASAVAPDMWQFHGREDAARVAALRARFGRPVTKAVALSTAADLASATPYLAVVDEILFDAKPPKGSVLPGGNGLPFDWGILAKLDLPVPFMLSGGLGPDNVEEALRATRAPAVDVASGVETAPGVKSADLIAAFVRAAHGGTTPDKDRSP